MESLAFQDDLQEKMREEMLDGKIVAMSPRPVVKHNVVAGNIFTVFKIFLKGKRCNVFSELDVYLSDKDRVVPDVMIVCNKDIIKKNGIYGAPDLIVEVLSPSTATRDKGYKKNLYEKCGVKEYWIVDADSCSIEVHLLEDDKFVLNQVYTVFPDYLLETMTEEEKAIVRHEFTTSLYPDMVISLEEVFEDLF